MKSQGLKSFVEFHFLFYYGKMVFDMQTDFNTKWLKKSKTNFIQNNA